MYLLPSHVKLLIHGDRDNRVHKDLQVHYESQKNVHCFLQAEHDNLNLQQQTYTFHHLTARLQP